MDMVLRIGILTASDRAARGERPDLSGPALVQLVTAQGWKVERTAVLPDNLSDLRATLTAWADEGGLDIIVTPEATRQVIEREAPGLSEAMRFESLKFTPHAMLSRARAGTRGKVLIINLPGSPRAAAQNFQVIIPVLPHAVELLQDRPNADKHH